MATTGGHVWPAARRLLEYIEATKPPEIVNEGARILELGSGTGWMGMTLAANLPDATQLCAPSTAIEFEKTWRRSCKSQDARWRYLGVTAGDSTGRIAKLFKVEINGTVLSELVSALAAGYVALPQEEKEGERIEDRKEKEGKER